MAVSSGRRKHRDIHGSEESLSPPPPRAPAAELVKGGGRQHRVVAATIPASASVTAAEAVASALRLWPASVEGNAPAIPEPSRVNEGSLPSASAVSANVRRVVAITEKNEDTEKIDLAGRPLSPSELDERKNSHGFPDLAPIAECPTEVIPERTPESSSRGSLRAPSKSHLGNEMPFRESSSSYCSLSTDVPSTSVNNPSPTDSPIDRPRHCPAPFLNHRRSRYETGCPVSFFLDGCSHQYFGRIRTMASNGTYTVDLVGGGRMAGLSTVSRCSVEDLDKAYRSKRPVITSESPWAALNSPNALPPEHRRTVEKIPIGTPVTFSLEDYVEPFYGYMRGIGRDGYYIIELIGGGRRTGVKEVTICSERDLMKVNRLRQGWRHSKDDYADVNSPNAPMWGGGCGYTSGYRETNPPTGTRRCMSMRAPSTPCLSLSSCSSSRDRRSLSPLSRRRNDSSGDDLTEGCAVSLFVEGDYRPHFGRIRSVEEDGRYTVDMIGGQRKAGVRTVFACSEVELEKEARTKQPIVTRRNAWEEVNTRNRLPHEHRSQSPKLRGVPINLPPRSSTILCA